jgi:2-phospho-L-lactate guanylyltransferase
MIWAVVPAKLGSESKVRLGSALSSEGRSRLAFAMLGDVLRALSDSSHLAGIAVVTCDPAVQRLASERGALVVNEPASGGLNGAVAAGIDHCISAGAEGVVVVMGDLPLLAATEVDLLVDRASVDGAVAARSLDGTGTNLLALRPPNALRTFFGPDSLALHRRAAALAGVAWSEVFLPGAALDVDTPADLARLLAAEGPRLESHALLRREGIAPALVARAGLS